MAWGIREYWEVELGKNVASEDTFLMAKNVRPNSCSSAKERGTWVRTRKQNQAVTDLESQDLSSNPALMLPACDLTPLL